ncbi:2-oxoacid:acceptor oxidoreductase subunit alpha [Candidatus Falkowbacteria bacterium CG10_big_fil_rev_8_21_14_0_10_43_10]|uniref:2-oxoacid:acceptor oxidoreductase subunit alpha n=1 Tax=Candidatus Falkowbacteria bacterium CG10_big_fil_rev_8_21_14_0_10_43_10 TaxID=1974567 RepID=A0A2H0V167_9BACT|nr:MAG: 2-oxoacid:acceptor oxidoreductase subunit alpha [Candidatus Falkowbacteria bacterium CG10_big_fil_rev_8_21_14_0_10_43_10]
MQNSINIKIGGPAGQGVKSIGLILDKMFMRSGYKVFGYTEYPSLIRGGHNTYQAYAGSESAFAQKRRLDMLIALDQGTIAAHQDELDDKTLVIFNQDTLKVAKTRGVLLPFPINDLIKKADGLPVMANIIALGAVCFLSGLEPEILANLVKETFGAKGNEMVKKNTACVKAGYNFAREKLAQYAIKLDPPAKKEKQILVTGNEALALGAVSAGLKFYSAYPMTPATSILHSLVHWAKKYSLVVKQTEDEISAINMALGASYAGARAMTATSGGGFALMTEAVGMAGIMELPLVIVESMRSGPSTGMPTWHSQADLRQVLHASQGDFPRAVLAPGDMQECFDLAREAFYLAEKYQLPVIILSDKYLSESMQSVPAPAASWQNKRYGFANADFNKAAGKNNEQPFKRYALSSGGISQRSVPGQSGGAYLSNSYEHDEFGYATEEAEMAVAMNDKRSAKFIELAKEVGQSRPRIFGGQSADVSFISWGSNKCPVLAALDLLKEKNISANFMHVNYIWPFPKEAVSQFIKNSKRIINVECNASGQFAGLVRQETGLKIKENLLKYDGRPFYAEDILTYVQH